MAAITFKCPNCGGELIFDPASQKYKCEYCISQFTQEELEAANPQTQQEQDGRETGNTGAEENGGRGQADSAVVYSCPSCGAEIVTDETTAATFCYYCHNPVVLQGRLSGEYRPDRVIPFAVDRKEAVESFLKYVRSKKFVPRDFFCEKQIEKISGVYFPFWMYSCRADGTWKGTGSRVRVYRTNRTEYTETKVFSIDRSADFTFRNLMRDALNKENKQLVEAVQPFRLEDTKEFSMGYLSGFQAEKRDMEKREVQEAFKKEVSGHAGQMLQASISGYTSVRPEHQEVRVRDEEWKYLLLPVWVLTYRGGDGKTYYYAMNGQTKKICGVLPVDKKRMAIFFFGLFVPIFILLLLGGYFVW